MALCSPGHSTQLWEMSAESEVEGDEGKGLCGMRMSSAAQGCYIGIHMEEGGRRSCTS